MIMVAINFVARLALFAAFMQTIILLQSCQPDYDQVIPTYSSQYDWMPMFLVSTIANYAIAFLTIKLVRCYGNDPSS